MLKTLNISTLILFVCFLFAPTITYALDADVDTYSLIVNEEEETSSKSKPKSNNSVNEEEEKHLDYFTLESIRNYHLNSKSNLLVDTVTNHTLKDDLVFKIPLPPPEQKL